MNPGDYRFTYDELLEAIGQRESREHMVTSGIEFTSPEDLFEALRLSFDNYPNEYESMRPKVLGYMSRNIHGNVFKINQKIIEVSK